KDIEHVGAGYEGLNVPRHISIVDLMHHQKSKQAIVDGDKQEFYNILFQIGFDISRGVESRECLHRPLCYKGVDNRVVKSVRWEGWERTDEAWLESPWVSEDMKDQLVVFRDLSLYQEMRGMSKYPKWSAMVEEANKKN